MRILVLSFYYKPDLCAGSFRATPFVNALSRQLPDEGEIEVLTTMPQRYSTYEQNAEKFEISGNITIYRIKLPSHQSGHFDQARAFFIYMVKSLWQVRKNKYDVIFATSSRLFTAFLGALISKWKKVSLYLDIRDIFTENLSYVIRKSFVSRTFIYFLRIIERFTINAATKINLVSKGFEEYFQNIRNNLKYTVITNGIDDEFLNYDFTKTSIQEKKIMTYAGNIGEGQGLEKIIPEMALYLGSGYEIRIIGDGGMRKILEGKLAKLNVDNVKIFAPVNRQKLMEYYKNSDFLFLHLNNYEPFKRVLPSKIFEYGATQKPTIAGVSGYAAEFIYTYLGDNWLVFEPANIQEFIAKFHKFRPRLYDSGSFTKQFNRQDLITDLVKDVLNTDKS